MKIEHIMSKNIIVVEVDTKIEEIAKIMKEKDIGFLPISKSNKIIGVLTDRDIVTKILANKDTKIEGYLTSNLISININESIENALKLMGNKKVKRILVEKDNKLVGILSISDIIHNVDEHLLIENIKKIWEIYRNTDEYPTKINDFEL